MKFQSLTTGAWCYGQVGRLI